MSSSSSRFVAPSLAAAFAASIATLAAPGAARADGYTISPGLSVSVSFGDKTVFGLGVDLRATTFLLSNTGCGNHAQIGLGPFAQVTWLNFSDWRVATGLHGGGELVKGYYGVDGELGWTYRTSFDDARPGGHGLHLGLLNALFPAVDLSVRGSLLWNHTGLVSEATIGAGGRFPLPVSPLSETCIAFTEAGRRL